MAALPDIRDHERARLRRRWAARLLPLSAALLLPAPAGGQAGIDGEWAGTIEAPIPIVFRVHLGSESGNLTGTIDWPAAGLLGVPLHQVDVEAERIRFELPTARGKIVFAGHLAEGSEQVVHGGVRLGALEAPFSLVGSSPHQSPYRLERLTFESDDVELAGTLFLPPGPGPHPAVVVLHGSGAERRAAGAWLADRFVRCGIASLVYDKRGVGGSSGGWERASFADLTGDGATAVAALRRRRDIDANRIGLVGPSQGAWLAPLVAHRDGRIAWLVLVSGGGVTPARHELHDDRIRLSEAGYSDSVVARASELQEELQRYLRTGEGRDELSDRLAIARGEGWFDLTELPPQPPPVSAVDRSWWRRHMDYDPVPLVETLGLPFLAVFGGEDRLVPVEESRQRLREVALAIPGSRVVVLPTADHTLHVWGAVHGSDPPGGFGWPRLAEGYPELVLAWVTERLAEGRRTFRPPGTCTVAPLTMP